MEGVLSYGMTLPKRPPAEGRPLTIVGWLPYQDSNLDKQNQNLVCYHYTIRQSHAAGSRDCLEADAKLRKKRDICKSFTIFLHITSIQTREPGDQGCLALFFRPGIQGTREAYRLFLDQGSREPGMSRAHFLTRDPGDQGGLALFFRPGIQGTRDVSPSFLDQRSREPGGACTKIEL